MARTAAKNCESSPSWPDIDWFRAGPARLAGLRCGMSTVREVIKDLGVSPRAYPQYFHVGPVNGYVSKTDLFREHYSAYVATVKRNWAAIGIPA